MFQKSIRNYLIKHVDFYRFWDLGMVASKSNVFENLTRLQSFGEFKENEYALAAESFYRRGSLRVYFLLRLNR
jgi:hypothetical protein